MAEAGLSSDTEGPAGPVTAMGNLGTIHTTPYTPNIKPGRAVVWFFADATILTTDLGLDLRQTR